MGNIKSLDDLKRIREAALQKRQLKVESGSIQIIVGMGTTGIAAGARETMRAILEHIEQKELQGITVRQTGNIGLDSQEPIVQVVIGENPKVTYGRVTPEVAQRILDEHIGKNQIIQENVIEA